MLKMTILKIRKICGVALIPRILQHQFTLSPKKLAKRPMNGFWKINKSSDSNDKTAECETCKKIIEKIFGPERDVFKKVEANLEDIHMDKLQKITNPSEKVNKSNVVRDGIVTLNNSSKVIETFNKDVLPTSKNQLDSSNTLLATTAKENKEELAQKMETIDEPSLVEAEATQSQDFDTPPKVLCAKETTFGVKNSHTETELQKDMLDEVAKKCLTSSPGKIDERILEELKNCGMLGRGRRKSKGKQGPSRSNKKEPLFETHSDESSLYCEKHKPNDISHENPFHDVKLTLHLDNFNSSDVKNVPFNSIGGERSKENDNMSENTHVNHEKEHTTLVPKNKHSVIDSQGDIPIVCKNNNSEAEVVLSEKSEPSKPLHFKGTPTETVEKDLKEILVAATEIGQSEATDRMEFANYFDQEPIKPDLLPYHQIFSTEKIAFDPSFEPDAFKLEAYAFTTHQPTDWRFGPNVSRRPFNVPNTAISGTYSTEEDVEPESEVKDTAISSHQNPGEFYDLSGSKMEKFEAYDMSPSSIRPFEAYHPYTIISSTDDVHKETIVEQLDISNSAAAFNVLTLKPVLSEEYIEMPIPKTHPPQTHDIPLETHFSRETPNETKNTRDVTMANGPSQLKDIEDELPLTEMLRRVREKNRLQYNTIPEHAESTEAKRCSPPKESKTLGPGPCKPKPKPASTPPKCPPPPCPPPCKPKDPCAKFKKTSLIGYKIKEAFSLVLSVGLKPTSVLSLLAYSSNVYAMRLSDKMMIDVEVHNIEKYGRLLSNKVERKKSVSGDEEVILARDYEPWLPIPSWPIPEKEKKESFVCPKEGCKLIPPPRLNPPCKENPCINIPKRSFSLNEFEYDFVI